MLKRISFSYGKPLKTAVVLLALAMGVFSSRADHFLWSNFSTSVDAPAGTEGTNEWDDVWEWQFGSTYSQNEQGGGEAYCDWQDQLTSSSQVDTHDYIGPVTGGHSIGSEASINSEITGSWVSDDDGPPTSATVYFTASLEGWVLGQTLVRQVIDPTNGDNGDVIYFMAGASAGLDYVLETSELPTFGEQMLAVGGGMTNGVPNSGMGGSAPSYGPAEITPMSFALEHDYLPDQNTEKWWWEQYVSCFLNVSDSYTIPVDSLSVSAHLETASFSDIDLVTKDTSDTQQTSSYRVYALVDSDAGILANFNYDIFPNYTAMETYPAIETIAGDPNSGGTYSGDGGSATSAGLSSPTGITFDPNGNLFFADLGNFAVREVSSGVINSTPISGSAPVGIVAIGDPLNVYFANADTAGIWDYVSDGNGGFQTPFELGDNGSFTPQSLTMDANGNFYVVAGGSTVVEVDVSGNSTTVAGNGTWGYSGDSGLATNASLAIGFGTSVAVDSQGNIYIADIGNNVIRKVDTSGYITTVAGNYGLGAGYSGNHGAATSAQLSSPSAVAIDSQGNLYIADTGNHVIRRVDTNGLITTVAGNGQSGYSSNVLGPCLNAPTSLAFDGSGNLYISDAGNNVIRKLTVN